MTPDQKPARELIAGDDYYYIPNAYGGESYTTMDECVAKRGSGWLVCDHTMLDRYRDLKSAYDEAKAETQRHYEVAVTTIYNIKHRRRYDWVV